MHGARRAEQRGEEHSAPSPALSNSDLERQTRRAFLSALAGAAPKQARTGFSSALSTRALAAPKQPRTALSIAKAAPEPRTPEQPFRAHCDLEFAQVAQAAQAAQVAQVLQELVSSSRNICIDICNVYIYI